MKIPLQFQFTIPRSEVGPHPFAICDPVSSDLHTQTRKNWVSHLRHGNWMWPQRRRLKPL